MWYYFLVGKISWLLRATSHIISSNKHIVNTVAINGKFQWHVNAKSGELRRTMEMGKDRTGKKGWRKTINWKGSNNCVMRWNNERDEKKILWDRQGWGEGLFLHIPANPGTLFKPLLVVWNYPSQITLTNMRWKVIVHSNGCTHTNPHCKEARRGGAAELEMERWGREKKRQWQAGTWSQNCLGKREYNHACVRPHTHTRSHLCHTTTVMRSTRACTSLFTSPRSTNRGEKEREAHHFHVLKTEIMLFL